MAKSRPENGATGGSERETPEKQEHPSYGVLTICRSQGGDGRLFGSPITHFNTVRLQIRRAAVERDLHHENYHGRESLIEVVMSPAQFAEAITSMNLGDGVPCTIRYVGGERQPPCPEELSRREKLEDEFQAKMKAAAAAFDDGLEKAGVLLEKKSLNREDRALLMGILRRARRTFNDRASFAGTAFNEMADDTVKAARAEIDAFASMVTRQAGLAGLTRLQSGTSEPVAPTLLLEDFHVGTPGLDASGSSPGVWTPAAAGDPAAPVDAAE